MSMVDHVIVFTFILRNSVCGTMNDEVVVVSDATADEEACCTS